MQSQANPVQSPHAPVPVWITGLGAISPLGSSVPETWRHLLDGRDGIVSVDRFDLGGIACTRGGQIVVPALPTNLAEDMLMQDPAAAFAWKAGQEALEQAGIIPQSKTERQHGTGLALATNFGCSIALEPKVRHARDPSATLCPAQFALPACQGALADRLASVWQCRGPRSTISLSCSAGAAALAWAAGLIRRGRADRMLVVGADALSPFAWYGLCALRTMTRDCIRPFDRNRSGTLFSEGAAALVLESAYSAEHRGVPPLALLRGWAVNNNAHHLTAPAPRGAGTARVLRAALDMAGINPADVDHYNAHGTATQPNDKTEAEALHDVLGPHVTAVPVTANKSALGHMLGAAGAIEAIACVQSLRHGQIPPTIHVETPDPDCAVDLVRDRPREVAIRIAVSNAAGIGGNNAALVITKL